MLKRITSFIRKYQEYRVRQIAFNELYRLTDKELQDIGMRRGEIHNKVRSYVPYV